MTHRKVEVWRSGMTLAKEVYRLVRLLPNDERFELGSQMRRAAASVPSNLAAGHGRKHRKQYFHHLSIARGSVQELQTHLELAAELKLIPKNEIRNAWKSTSDLRNMLTAMLLKLSD